MSLSDDFPLVPRLESTGRFATHRGDLVKT